jgi:hypothetical protein
MMQSAWSWFNQIRNGWLFVALLVLAGILYDKYGEMMLAPNHYVLSMGFDAIKNYFTTAWHIKYDATRLGYTGMNYPYGEHVLFTDNQPILANTTRFLSSYFPGLADYSIGVVNLFQIFSLFLTVFVLFILFRRLQLPAWYGALAGLILVFLTPQHYRWDAHFGLSHAWIIPSLLIMLHTYEQKTYRRRISLKIGLLAIVAAQLHMYYFGLFFLFLTTYHLVSFLRSPKSARLYKRIVHWMLMVLLPYAVLNFWIKAAHFAADRPANPYGFDTYRGYWEGVLLPYPQWPLYQWIDSHITKIRPYDGEASAYIGIIATLFFVFVILRGFRLFSTTEKTTYGERLNRNYLRNIWWSGVILSVFACGFPHAIKGLEWISELYGPIRQFRSMGRFNWVLFYIFNTVALFWLWHFAAKRQQLWQKALILTLPFCILTYEAITHQKLRPVHVQANCLTKINDSCGNNEWQKAIDPTTYQAIFPLPYYHSGSENLFLDPKYDVLLLTQRIGFQTHLPDMGVNMSRTSIDQMIQSAQLMLEPTDMPHILHDLESDKDILLLTTPQYKDEVSRRFGHITSKSQQVYASDQVILSRLPLDSLRRSIRSVIDLRKSEIRNQSLTSNKWLSTGEGSFFVHRSFDDLKSAKNSLAGTGALEASMSDTTRIYAGPIPVGSYYTSIWIDVTKDMGMTSEMKIYQFNQAGQEIHMMHEACRFHLKTIKDGWALFDIYFEVKNPDTQIDVFLFKKGVHAPVTFDEIQIRSAKADSWYKDDRYLVKNNRWYQD